MSPNVRSTKSQPPASQRNSSNDCFTGKMGLVSPSRRHFAN